MTTQQGPREPLEEQRAEIARLQEQLAAYQEVERRILAHAAPHSYREQALAILDGKAAEIFKSPDHVEQFLLQRRAVEVLRKQPEIDMFAFARQVGLYEENDQLGLVGWYRQFAGEVLKRERAG